MRMRAVAPRFVCVVAVAAFGCLAACCTGCTAARAARPDAAVAAAVERAHRKHIQSLTMLASADDGVVLAAADRLAGDGLAGETAADEAPTYEEGGDASAADASPAWLELAVPAFCCAAEQRPGGPDGLGRGRGRERREGLPNLKFNVMHFQFRGRPVEVKCTVRDKKLVFGAKVQM